MNDQEPVHQLYFSFSFGAGQGLRLTGSSLPPETDEQWNSQLDGRIRLQPDAQGRVPTSALSYHLVGDDHAVLLRRHPHGVSTGRNDSHALLASKEVLTPTMAIDLAEWPGWLTAPPALQLADLSVADLHRHLRTAGTSRAREVADWCDVLVGALACLLDRPTTPISIVGCPEYARIPIVWGLRFVGERAAADRGGRLDWTFSTYEVAHDASVRNLPEIVFLPEPQRTAMSSIPRSVVNVDRPHDQASVAAVTQAQAWVNHRLFNGPAPQGRTPVAANSGAGHSGAGAGQGQPDRLAGSSAVRDPVERHPVLTGVDAGGEGYGRFEPHAPAGPAPVEPATAAPKRIPSKQAAAQTTAPGTSAGEYSASLRNLLAATRTDDVVRFAEALREVAQNYGQQRGRLRKELDGPALSRVTRFIDLTAGQLLTAQLADCLIGPDGKDVATDVGAAQKIAELLEHTDSDQFERAVLARLDAGPEQGAIAAAVTRRITRLARQEEPREPTMARWLNARADARRARWSGVVLGAVALLLLLILVFVLGRSTAPTVSATGPLPPAAAPATAPRMSAAQSGTSTVPPGNEVFMVLRKPGTDVPAGIPVTCALSPAAGAEQTWQCPPIPIPDDGVDHQTMVFRAPEGTIDPNTKIDELPAGAVSFGVG